MVVFVLGWIFFGKLLVQKKKKLRGLCFLEMQHSF